ncbi:MAG: lysophospholipid acyltransferase family protein [Candidatus Aureabacteria bacterium]|nr:lysophospholipid acyltransferase family protein [Candidatus Auribacterota bacterium]
MKITWADIKDIIIINFASFIIYLICKTQRVVRYDDESVRPFYEKGENVIFALWHRRLLYLTFYHPRRFPEKKVCVIASQSRDGTRIGKTAKKLGVNFVQGSSSKGGAKALKELLRILKKGDSVAITPDGPRGPFGVVQKGVISLAKLSGRPIIPISYQVSKAIKLKTWDRFVIPIPFSRVIVKTGEPIFLSRDDEKEDSHCENIIKKGIDALEVDVDYHS